VFTDLPASAAWRHEGARHGFEAVFVRADPSGHVIDGHTTAVEDGQVWVVRYTITVDANWLTRRARIRGWSARGTDDTRLAGDGSGHWEVDGAPASELAGCLDVDLESSACTNMIPVRRMRLRVGQASEAPAAYVRALGLHIERLEQTYLRLDDERRHQRYDYRAPRFDFEGRLIYDADGFVLDYPGIATRVQ
jgi:uncharacterized protein